MRRQEKVLEQKKRGRPAIGKGTQVNVMFRPEIAEALDQWAAKEELSRPDGVRRIVSEFLQRRGFLAKE